MEQERDETADAMRGIVAKLLRKRKKKLLVATNHVYDGHRSRNAFEESLLVLRDMIPRQIKVIVLANRGFGRTALATFCQQQGFGYVIRLCAAVPARVA